LYICVPFRIAFDAILQKKEHNNMKIKFLSLASGSSGNCYYLGTETYGILIDSGIGVRTIKKSLKEYGLALERVKAVFITHDHADHIKSVGTLGEKYGIPVYTTPEIHVGINKNYCMTEKLTSASVRYIHKEEPIQLEDFKITAFEVPHDGTDNVGYCIEADNKVFSFLTDMGEITPTAAQYICKTNYLVIEANYDEEMLQMGPYPQHLKVRIAGPNGHMSNRNTATFLAENLNENLKNIWLCHLSKDNNHPDLALKTFEYIFRSKGIIVGKDVQLAALKRLTPSEFHEFE
jgi:phosphoribosyl 1,2-cyclic phosphodiesterase